LPLEEAVELTCQLCDGLGMAHSAGIIHRDVKPANILLTSRGEPKLTDFGLARQNAGNAGQTMAGSILGTLDFMPPEQRHNARQTDHRSDQWSLAATFYQLVSGELPRVIDTELIPMAVRDTILRALKTNPADRFETMLEYRQQLRSTVSQRTSAVANPLELNEGQCADCDVLNDSSRQFCKGCGTSLICSCPKCGCNIPIWERYCGSCGVDLRTEVESRQAAAQELRDEVQSLRASYRHADVLNRLQPLVDARHPALTAHCEWAREIQQTLSRELDTLSQQQAELQAAAREQLDQGRFKAAQKHLDLVPTPLRSDETRQLIADVSARSAEAQALTEEIQQAIEAREYDGLEERVTRYLELKPNNTAASRLLARLTKKRQTSRAPAQPVPNDAASTDGDAYADVFGSQQNSQPYTISVPIRQLSRHRRNTDWRGVLSAPRVQRAAGLLVTAMIVIAVWTSSDPTPTVPGSNSTTAAGDIPTTDPSTTGSFDFNNGLVAYYPLNGNAKDESEGGKDGVIIVGGLRATVNRFGAINSAFDFGSKGGYITFGHSPRLALQEFTISVWFRGGSDHPTNIYRTILAKGEGGQLRHLNYMFLVTDTNEKDQGGSFLDIQGGTLVAVVGHGDGLAASILASRVNVRDGSWHNAMLISDPGARRIILYVDGKHVGVRENAPPVFTNANVDLTSGIWGGAGYGPWDGQIDDVRIYNRALSPEEINALYDFESDPPSA